jgi:predicted Zn-dependent protease
VEVVLALARACVLAGRMREAADSFKEALRLRPGHLETRISAAEFHMSRGDYAAADALLPHDTIEINRARTDARYQYVKARALVYSGELDRALEALADALERRPTEIEYLSFKSDVLRRIGRVAEATKVSKFVGALSFARRRLFLIEKELDVTRPDPKQCQEIAELMDLLKNSVEAKLWREAALLNSGKRTNE